MAHPAGDLQARRARRRVRPLADRPAHPVALRLRLPSEQRGEATGSGFVIDKTGTSSPTPTSSTARARSPSSSPTSRPSTATILGRTRPPTWRCSRSTPKPRPYAARPRDSANGSRWAIRRSRSATRSGSSARSPPASSRRCSADPGAQRLHRSTTSSRPTRRSTRATPAARSSTRPGRVIGINSQIATGGNGSNGNVGSASPSRSTPRKRLLPDAEEERPRRPRLPRRRRADDRRVAEGPQPARQPGRARPDRHAGQPGRQGRACGPATSSATLDGHQIQLGGDIITGRREEDPQRRDAPPPSPTSTGDEVKIACPRRQGARPRGHPRGRPTPTSGRHSPVRAGVTTRRAPPHQDLRHHRPRRRRARGGGRRMGARLILWPGSPRALRAAERRAHRRGAAPPGRALRRVRQRPARRGRRRPPTRSA